MKPKHKMIAAILTVALLATAGLAQSDDDDGTRWFQSWFDKAKPGIDPVGSQRYVEECGSCHFPYQPGLLPAPSWEKIMGSLDDHFGENAELDEGDRKTIQNYLLNNAAGRVNYGLSNKLMAAQRERPLPLRITEMRYFAYEHSEIPKELVQENPKVRSFSNCDSCHQRAKRGLYDEHDVRIPGFGRWDD
jgi:hypothetical protein